MVYFGTIGDFGIGGYDPVGWGGFSVPDWGGSWGGPAFDFGFGEASIWGGYNVVGPTFYGSGLWGGFDTVADDVWTAGSILGTWGATLLDTNPWLRFWGPAQYFGDSGGYGLASPVSMGAPIPLSWPTRQAAAAPQAEEKKGEEETSEEGDGGTKEGKRAGSAGAKPGGAQGIAPSAAGRKTGGGAAAPRLKLGLDWDKGAKVDPAKLQNLPPSLATKLGGEEVREFNAPAGKTYDKAYLWKNGATGNLHEFIKYKKNPPGQSHPWKEL